MSDSADAGRQIIDHLAALGHRSLTYLGGPANAWVDGERSRALSEFAARAGINVIRRGPFAPTLEGGSAAADIGVASGTTASVRTSAVRRSAPSPLRSSRRAGR